MSLTTKCCVHITSSHHVSGYIFRNASNIGICFITLCIYVLYCCRVEMFSLILNHAIRGYPRDSPPVSLLITVLQHVFVLYVLNLHYDSLEVTSIIKSVGWGYWGVGGFGLIWLSVTVSLYSISIP